MPFFRGAPPAFPEDDPTCFISLYAHKNATEVWDTTGDFIRCSTWTDLAQGHQFTQSTDANRPKLHGNSLTLNKYGGIVTPLFEGADTGNEDYLDWPAGALDYLKNLASFTFMGIIKPSAAGVYSRIFTISDSNSATNVLWGMEFTAPNEIRMTLQRPGFTTTSNVTTTDFTAGTDWYKVAGVVDYNYSNGGAAVRGRIYVDEVNYKDTQGVFASTSAANTVNAASLRGEIGTTLSKTANFFQGNIAHMSFYQRAIEPEEQANIWRAISERLAT